jgi:hypothetical protein
MTEVLLPTWIVPEEETHEWLDEGSSVFAAAFAPGIAQRQSYGGLRLKMSRRHTVRAEEKAQLLSILNNTRGRYNVLRTKVHFALRGSGFGSELVSNNTFANGTTGWTAGTPTPSPVLSVADRILRITRSAAGLTTAWASQSATVTQYAPHAWRFHVSANKSQTPRATFSGLATTVDGAYGLEVGAAGMSTAWFVPPSSSHTVFLDNTTSLSTVAGDFFAVDYCSLARGPLVDNRPNGLLHSDDFSNAAWVKNTGDTVSANAGTAPDGNSTADDFVENGASQEHYIEQAYTVAATSLDFCGVIDIKATGRSFVVLSLIENTGSTFATVYANLTTGARTNESVGANWANIRTFSVDRGNGWFRFFIVARKTNAATTIRIRANSTNAAGGSTIQSGLSATAFRMWRGGLYGSSVPFDPAQTTTTAATGTAQTGNALYVKGLPASTNGLLLPGDWIEIGGELKQVSAALNSDAAGLGYLQFEPAIVRSPANDDPVIVIDPMGKFLVSNIKVQNQFGTQAVVTYDLEHIYE